jgi:hypothetical protein
MALALDEALRRLGFYAISTKKRKETGQPNASKALSSWTWHRQLVILDFPTLKP